MGASLASPRRHIYSVRDRASPPPKIGGTLSALAISADVGYPLQSAAAACGGARTYFESAFTIASQLVAETSRLSGYAERYRMAAAVANFGGTSGGPSSGGSGAIWAGGGDLPVRLPAAGLGVAVVIERASGWGAATALRRRLSCLLQEVARRRHTAPIPRLGGAEAVHSLASSVAGRRRIAHAISLQRRVT